MVYYSAFKPAFFRVAVVVLALFTALSGIAAAHPDPPRQPPAVTSVEVARLAFLRDLDDGLTLGGSDGEAEIVVVVTVLWGGSHGSSQIIIARTVDMDGRGPWVVAPPRIPGVAHLECEPVLSPGQRIDAKEIDEDPGLFVKGFAAGLAGVTALIGSGGNVVLAIGASSVTYNSITLLAALNGNDTLVEGRDFEIALDDLKTQQAADSRCGALPPSPTPAPTLTPIATPVISGGGDGRLGAAIPPPPGGSVPPPPAPRLAAVSDAQFRQAARNTPPGSAPDDDPLNLLISLSDAVFGVDDVHPFGRSKTLMAVRFGLLRDVLAAVDARALESGPGIALTPAQFEENGNILRGGMVGLAYINAAQEVLEAQAAGAAAATLQQAVDLMNQARVAADAGDFRGSIDRYEAAVLLLIEVNHPTFNDPAAQLADFEALLLTVDEPQTLFVPAVAETHLADLWRAAGLIDTDGDLKPDTAGNPIDLAGLDDIDGDGAVGLADVARLQASAAQTAVADGIPVEGRWNLDVGAPAIEGDCPFSNPGESRTFAFPPGVFTFDVSDDGDTLTASSDFGSLQFHRGPGGAYTQVDRNNGVTGTTIVSFDGRRGSGQRVMTDGECTVTVRLSLAAL